MTAAISRSQQAICSNWRTPLSLSGQDLQRTPGSLARAFALMKARTRPNAAQDEGWRGACAEFGLVGARRGRDTRTPERIVKAFCCRGREKNAAVTLRRFWRFA